MTECRDLTSPGNKQNETTFQTEPNVEIYLRKLLKTLFNKKDSEPQVTTICNLYNLKFLDMYLILNKTLPTSKKEKHLKKQL